MRELLQEIMATIARNKLRTFLTGFSVAWGIFMLVILLGSGNGLKNGVLSNFGNMATNQGQAWGGRTSMPYKGYQSGRTIHLRTGDKEVIARNNPKVTDISARYSIYDKTVTYDDQYASVAILGIETLYEKINGVTMLEGRFISKADVDGKRKVVVLEDNCVKVLSPKKSIVGRDVVIDRVIYTVIGVYKSMWSGYSTSALVPLSTVQALYAHSDIIHEATYLIDGVNNVPESETFDKEIRGTLAVEHIFDPSDQRAAGAYNTVREFSQVQTVFSGISVFIWIIGLGTLLAGIVGVSNIMLVTVRERTSEFGIRKSMGATPASLVRLVLVESVLITAVFGYIGMILGVGVMEIVNVILERSIAARPAEEFGNPVIFLNPTLQMSIVFSATAVLVIAGVVAGYIPARRAARLKTIDAMRYNK